MQPTVLDRPISGRQAWTRADVTEGDYRVILSDAVRELIVVDPGTNEAVWVRQRPSRAGSAARYRWTISIWSGG